MDRQCSVAFVFFDSDGFAGWLLALLLLLSLLLVIHACSIKVSGACASTSVPWVSLLNTVFDCVSLFIGSLFYEL
uniref:Uncharacterized protein n=1 Tax=Rhizophora mucronata TaxID=61149 RepID=A0A2P2P304_RHIMU